MKKVNLIGLSVILGMFLVGCEMTGSETENTENDLPDVVENHDSKVLIRMWLKIMNLPWSFRQGLPKQSLEE